ncbi:polysaccharide deacetylase family protein [Fictibacillus barbaricus]|uniref:DUF4309 domain-containing protein n=1 Tax=Fictibacillus barbaricus TaxID=182136 RepID=A0ABS2Z7U9_9BACL|nr:polysaccharide deacetylase family protein [Fictibacillus barbaricus]MBN3544150.1 DUF4309 domain-containing protein [Fictibacillus barbaricus]GGB69333.1 hypothetical protein GCM10007199_39430 [Fictibacillus barbaricus]
MNKIILPGAMGRIRSFFKNTSIEGLNMKGPNRFFFLLLLTVLLTACNREVEEIVPLSKETKVSEEKEKEKEKEKEIKKDKDHKNIRLIRRILDLASKGMVPDSDFKLSDHIKEVHNKWGDPSKTDRYKEYFYENYSNRTITFGYSGDGEIFDIRSYNKELGTLTFGDITSSIGKPEYSRNVNNELIYGYRLQDGIELKFIVPERTGKVDHISIYRKVENQEKTVPPKLVEKYILDIKGTSKKLSGTAWANMLKSREQMKTLARDYEGRVILNGPNQKMVALTFDDGPDRKITPGIIDILKKYQVRGSFFFVGEKVRQNQDVVKTAFQAGNLVLSHSFYHNDLSKQGKGEITNDLRMTNVAIEEVIGKSPALFRPPYGATNRHVITTSQEQGLKIVLWSIDTLDWSQKESHNISQNVLTNVRNGDIILFHSDEDKAETLRALPSIITGLQKKGFQVVTLDTLLNTKAYQ